MNEDESRLILRVIDAWIDWIIDDERRSAAFWFYAVLISERVKWKMLLFEVFDVAGTAHSMMIMHHFCMYVNRTYQSRTWEPSD